MFSNFRAAIHVNNSLRWFVRGRIKEKISAIYAIKYQVYCMENTVQWSANTVVILILIGNQCSKQPPLISLPAYNVYS